MGYGRFEGVETARVMARLYAAARLYVNFFQPSFKLKDKRRQGAKVIKRYHAPSAPFERALAHPQVTAAVKQRLRDQYRALDPVALLAEVRAAQEELGNRVDRRAGDAPCQKGASQGAALQPVQSSTPDAVAFAKALGTTIQARDPRATHRRPKRPYKRVRMPPSSTRMSSRSRTGLHAADRVRHRWSAEREIPRSIRNETAFDRAASRS